MRTLKLGLNNLVHFYCLCAVVGAFSLLTAVESVHAEQDMSEVFKVEQEISANNVPSMNLNKSGIVGSSLPPRSDMFGSFSKGIIYCIGIFLIFLAVKHKLKLKNDNSSDNPIHILARKPVGYRVNMMLVEVDGKKFLVSHNGDSVHLISEITDDSYLSEAAGQ